ncbi:uncharacterized protein LOC129726398 [Wyeomyia smithii]|uniref:uncharacterized protein LOC129726398 n=1 Tax=Wyeomyia smithii TaxID=174621 RepID=UPI002467D3F2|nr:uncharacterized protein LOC129726398 [Wyeomyia smithii]
MRVPRCYYTHSNMEKLEAVVIMEDLREKHFRMWNKYVPVDYEHTRMLLEQLGKLHAISFAMREQQPERFFAFKRLIDPMKIMIEMDPDKGIDKLFGDVYQRAIVTLDDAKDAKVKELMKKLEDKVTKHYVDCVTVDDSDPYAVIGHGDCWINNMMYMYEEESPVPVDIRLIDWQLCRYVSPILDLSYFIFICTDAKLRAQHYNQLLDIYYSSLCDYLERLGGDAKRQFPREAYEAQWKKYGRFGLIMGMLVVPMICTAAEDLPDMDKWIEKMKQGDEDVEFEYATEEKAAKLYRARMSGVIRDVARFGYLTD